MEKSTFWAYPVMLFLFLGLSAQAQISKGDWLLGTSIGSASVTSSTDNNSYKAASTSYAGTTQSTTETEFSLSLTPQVGYFVANNLAVGGALSLSFSTDRSNQNTTAGSGFPNSLSNDNTYTLTAGPFVRYYFGDPVLTSTLFFMQVNARAGTSDGISSGSGGRTTYTYTSSGQTSGGFNWNAGGEMGVIHFISKSVGLIADIGYTYLSSMGTVLDNTNYSYKGTSTGAPTSVDDHTFNDKSGEVTVAVGFNLYLPSKKK